jgi:hypothetical protein
MKREVKSETETRGGRKNDTSDCISLCRLLPMCVCFTWGGGQEMISEKVHRIGEPL